MVDVAEEVTARELGAHQADHHLTRRVRPIPSRATIQRAHLIVDQLDQSEHPVQLGDRCQPGRRREVRVVTAELDWAGCSTYACQLTGAFRVRGMDGSTLPILLHRKASITDPTPVPPPDLRI